MSLRREVDPTAPFPHPARRVLTGGRGQLAVLGLAALAALAPLRAAEGLPEAVRAGVAQAMAVVQGTAGGTGFSSSGFVVAKTGAHGYVLAAVPPGAEPGVSLLLCGKDRAVRTVAAADVARSEALGLAVYAVPAADVPDPVPRGGPSGLAALTRCYAAGFPFGADLTAAAGAFPEVSFQRASVMGRRTLPDGRVISLLALQLSPGGPGSALLGEDGSLAGVVAGVVATEGISLGTAWQDVVDGLLAGSQNLRCGRGKPVPGGWSAVATATLVDPMGEVRRAALAVLPGAMADSPPPDLFSRPDATQLVLFGEGRPAAAVPQPGHWPVEVALPLSVPAEDALVALAWLQSRTVLRDGRVLLGKPTPWRFALERPAPPDGDKDWFVSTAPAGAAPPPAAAGPGPGKPSKSVVAGTVIRRFRIPGDAQDFCYERAGGMPALAVAARGADLYWLDALLGKLHSCPLASVESWTTAAVGRAGVIGLCGSGVLTRDGEQVHLWRYGDLGLAWSLDLAGNGPFYWGADARYVPVATVPGKSSATLQLLDTARGRVVASYPVVSRAKGGKPNEAGAARGWGEPAHSPSGFSHEGLRVAALAPDGSVFACVEGGQVRTWQVRKAGLEPGPASPVFTPRGLDVQHLAFSGDSRFAIVYEAKRSLSALGPDGDQAQQYLFRTTGLGKPFAVLEIATYGWVVDVQDDGSSFLVKDEILTCFGPRGEPRGEVKLPGRFRPCASRSPVRGRLFLTSRETRPGVDMLVVDWNRKDL